MSSTRYSKNGSQLSQERWCSSADFDTGINANLAAKRINLLTDDRIKNILWFIQWKSIQPGGLGLFARQLLEVCADRFGSPSLRKLKKAQGKLSSEQVKEIMREWPVQQRFQFPLKGDNYDIVGMFGGEDSSEDFPNSYDASELWAACKESAEGLADFLKVMCLDPSQTVSSFSVWYLDNLIECIEDVRNLEMTATKNKLAETKISTEIIDTLDFAFRRGRMVLIEGKAGVGKSATVKSWCQQKSGLVRYVEVPSSNDDRSFYAVIGEALGVARGTAYNGQQIKLRVEEVLKTSGLMLVLDECQFLWPQFTRPRGTPIRLQWLKTMWDAGVKIALVAHSDFSKWQDLYVKKTCWSDEQFERRLNRKIRLPEIHPTEDLIKIAEALHPDGTLAQWKLLAGYARTATKKQASAILEALESAVDRAQQAGRTSASFEDIDAAISMDHMASEHGQPAVTPPAAQRPDLAAQEPTPKPTARAAKPRRDALPTTFAKRQNNRSLTGGAIPVP